MHLVAASSNDATMVVVGLGIAGGAAAGIVIVVVVRRKSRAKGAANISPPRRRAPRPEDEVDCEDYLGL